MNRSIVIKGALALSLVLLLFLSEYLWDIVSLVHPDRVQEILVKAGPLAPLLYMIIMALAVVISPIPSVPLDVAAGVFFGPLLGTTTLPLVLWEGQSPVFSSGDFSGGR